MTLSIEQQAVVDAILNRPRIVVTSAAGSGKTRTLIACYTKMVQSGVPVAFIAIVTYTQAAAAELSQRIRDQELPEPGFVGTLHSLMLRLLRNEGQRMGFYKGVAVVDERTAHASLRESMKRVSFKGSFQQAQKIVASPSVGSKEAMLFNDYHQKLGQDGLVTFDGILYWASRILKDNGGVVPFTHLMIDEYQDVSRADHDLYLAMKVSNRFVVGDVRQAIFGFRGGDPTCMEELVKSPEWTAFSLKTNHRSTSEIVEVANKLAPKLPVKDAMLAASCGHGRHEVFDIANEHHQFEAICDFISDFDGTSRAIICRYNWQIAAISEYLRDHEIPHRVHGAAKKPPQWEAAQALVGFLGNPESEVMAYALAVASTSEAEAMNMRKLAIDTCHHLGQVVWSGDFPPISDIKTILSDFNLDSVTQGAVLSVHDQLSIMDRSWSSLAAAMADPAALTPKIADSTVPLLCTIHASKGREFDSVCLPYWSDELFPGNRASGDEEEWRLAYVAITRARTNLVICSVAESPMYPGGQLESMTPSRFIKAITA